jgi:formylglycine-generating enzyme required for sulfatase activity
MPQRFAREHPQFGLAQSYLDKYSPDPNGPMIAVSWFGAVAYCNWLSQQGACPRINGATCTTGKRSTTRG